MVPGLSRSLSNLSRQSKWPQRYSFGGVVRSFCIAVDSIFNNWLASALLLWSFSQVIGWWNHRHQVILGFEVSLGSICWHTRTHRDTCTTIWFDIHTRIGFLPAWLDCMSSHTRRMQRIAIDRHRTLTQITNPTEQLLFNNCDSAAMMYQPLRSNQLLFCYRMNDRFQIWSTWRTWEACEARRMKARYTVSASAIRHIGASGYLQYLLELASAILAWDDVGPHTLLQSEFSVQFSLLFA